MARDEDVDLGMVMRRILSTDDIRNSFDVRGPRQKNWAVNVDRTEGHVPEVRDGLDAILLGSFLFGLLLAVGFFALGGADLDGGDGGNSPLPFGVGALLVAVAWTGGIGYLLRWVAGWPLALVLPVAVVVGLAMGIAVQRGFVAFGRASGDDLRPEAYRLPGTLGHVAIAIRPGGIGEVIYEQGGVRQVVAARATEGAAIARGTEVVVLKVERGVATVEPFDALLGDRTPPLVLSGDERQPTGK